MPNYDPSPDGNCPETLGFNVRVNQDCLTLSDDDLQVRARSVPEVRRLALTRAAAPDT